MLKQVSVLYNSQVLKKGEPASFLRVLAGVVSTLCTWGLFRDVGGGDTQVCFVALIAEHRTCPKSITGGLAGSEVSRST